MAKKQFLHREFLNAAIPPSSDESDDEPIIKKFRREMMQRKAEEERQDTGLQSDELPSDEMQSDELQSDEFGPIRTQEEEIHFAEMVLGGSPGMQNCDALGMLARVATLRRSYTTAMPLVAPPADAQMGVAVNHIEPPQSMPNPIAAPAVTGDGCGGGGGCPMPNPCRRSWESIGWRSYEQQQQGVALTDLLGEQQGRWKLERQKRAARLAQDRRELRAYYEIVKKNNLARLRGWLNDDFFV